MTSSAWPPLPVFSDAFASHQNASPSGGKFSGTEAGRVGSGRGVLMHSGGPSTHSARLTPLTSSVYEKGKPVAGSTADAVIAAWAAGAPRAIAPSAAAAAASAVLRPRRRMFE